MLYEEENKSNDNYKLSNLEHNCFGKLHGLIWLKDTYLITRDILNPLTLKDLK